MLFWIFCILSAVGDACLYLFLPTPLHPLWLFPIFLGGVLAINLLYLLLLLISTLFLPRSAPRKDSAFCRLMIRLTADWILVWFGVYYRVEGLEKLPAEPMVFVCNHRSMFDPIVTFCALSRRKTAFVSKLANMRIPILGPYANRCFFLGIDRDSPLKALRTIRRAGDLVKEHGVDFGIYPEGTRTKDGRMHAYKEGAFVAARRAESPIAVFAIQGTERAGRHPHPFRRVLVRLELLSVIPKEDVMTLTPKELALRAERITKAALGETE